MGMVDDGHVNTSQITSAVTITSAVVQFGFQGLRVAMSDHYYYCCCLGLVVHVVQHSLITFDVVVFLVHRLHSVFALVMFMSRVGCYKYSG
jgi:hypothetical protein